MPTPPLASRFTHANAREMAARSTAARAKRRAAILQAALNPPAASLASLSGADDYHARLLSRVRHQLDLIDERLALLVSKPQSDPLAIERLSRAAAAISERERNLAMRPAAGNLRQSAPRQSSASASAASLSIGHSPSSNAHRPPPRPIAPTIAPTIAPIAPPHDPTEPPSASD